MTPMDHERLLRGMYAHFNAREIAPLLEVFAPDVEWPRAWEGDPVRGHEAVRDYWTRQWAEIDPRVEPMEFVTLPDGRVRVQVAQTVRDLSGAVLSESEVAHVYTFEQGLVARMEIEAPDALKA